MRVLSPTFTLWRVTSRRPECFWRPPGRVKSASNLPNLTCPEKRTLRIYLRDSGSEVSTVDQSSALQPREMRKSICSRVSFLYSDIFRCVSF